jgi:ABC-2 type transport system ATP-binding protein
MAEAAIRADGLSKTFGGGWRGREVRALDNVSLEVHPGEMFGLLGPNGAGKTTFVKILLGALHPSSGGAYIFDVGCNNWASRKKAAFLPENHRFPAYLTGLEMLCYFGGLAGFSRSEVKAKAGQLLQVVDMASWGNTKIRKYSKGMMQRLGLAQALLTDPQVIFLDEPTDGVDPIGRHEIRQILLKLKAEGKTIFLNSHLLSEVESICDRVAILDKGRLIKVGPVVGLIDVRPTFRIETAQSVTMVAEAIISTHPQAVITDRSITLALDDAVQINRVIDLLRQNQIDILAVVPIRASLEDNFMELIKGNRDDA